MSNNQPNISSNFLQVPSTDEDAPPSRRRFAGIIPIRRHSTGSRHSGTIQEPRRPIRKSTIIPPVGLITVIIIFLCIILIHCINVCLPKKIFLLFLINLILSQL